MLIIPAIDLKNGQCVRLKQGLMGKTTVFSDQPVKMAKHWLQQGARRLHLVDLNGAFEGKLVNLTAITEILNYLDKKIIVQLGGGIRNLQTIEHLLALGLDFVILGTSAVKNLQLVREACRLFPTRIIIGIDANNGWVATDGWANITNKKAIDLAKEYEDYDIASIIYTDIGRDGMLSGVNIESTLELAKHIKIPIIASGGVTNIEDIRKLCELSISANNLSGVITGRAIYEGNLDFQEAQKLADSFGSK